MLITSVILVLREVLEAALLISLLMALSQRSGHPGRWVPLALIVGMLGAAIYGFNVDRVSEWFDGVGQEVVNASLQLCIYLTLCLVAGLVVRQTPGNEESAFPHLLAIPVALAVVREGSEIMIYLSGFLQIPDQMTTVLAGSAIGLGIGMSAGAVFYFAMLSLGVRPAKLIGGLLLTLIAAGMIAQATQSLIQADWLPAQYPLWDSTWLVDEQSTTGQLLYALVGYESTPTALQAFAYLVSMAVMAGIVLTGSRNMNSKHV